MNHQVVLIVVSCIVILLVLLAVLELGYIIYLMQSDANSVSSILNHSHGRQPLFKEEFNPQRNYPQPPDSVIRDGPPELYYAAGNTEVPNDITHIRDDYYAKNVKHY